MYTDKILVLFIWIVNFKLQEFFSITKRLDKFLEIEEIIGVQTLLSLLFLK